MTAAWNFSSQASECWSVLIDTNTVTPALTRGASSTATRRLMTPASSSF